MSNDLPDQIGILLHSLGLRVGGITKPFRNHFLAGGKNIKLCNTLVKKGLMRKAPADWRAPRGNLYHVTDEGRRIAEAAAKPKRLCPACERFIRLKKDGSLYRHKKGPLGSPWCPGGKPHGASS